MKNSIPNSKSTICVFPIFLHDSITSCKKEDVAILPVVDTQSFFTITIDSNEYTTNGYYDAASPIPYGGPTLTQYTGVNAAGDPVSFIALEAADSYTGGNNSMGSNPLSIGNCKLQLSMQKDDPDLLGVYTDLVGHLSEQTINRNTAEEFYFNRFYCRLIIERIAQHPSRKADMVEGYISCSLFTSTGDFRYLLAAGNFRMYLNK